MNELVEKHDIEPGFYIYLQRNSLVWLARFKVEGKWISRTTKERDKTPAGSPVWAWQRWGGCGGAVSGCGFYCDSETVDLPW